VTTSQSHLLPDLRSHERPRRRLFPNGPIKLKSGETIEAAEVQGCFRETYPNERGVIASGGRTVPLKTGFPRLPTTPVLGALAHSFRTPVATAKILVISTLARCAPYEFSESIKGFSRTLSLHQGSTVGHGKVTVRSR
jgi:hypothetical protein